MPEWDSGCISEEGSPKTIPNLSNGTSLARLGSLENRWQREDDLCHQIYGCFGRRGAAADLQLSSGGVTDKKKPLNTNAVGNNRGVALGTPTDTYLKPSVSKCILLCVLQANQTPVDNIRRTVKVNKYIERV